MAKSETTAWDLSLILGRLGIAISVFGFLLITFLTLLSFYPSFWGLGWLLSDQTFLKISVIMVMGGFSSSLCFLSWVKYPISSLKLSLLGLLFNYLPAILVIGGGLLYLWGYYGIDDANLALKGLRCHFAGYVGLILKFGYWIPHLNRLATEQDSNTKIGN